MRTMKIAITILSLLILVGCSYLPDRRYKGKVTNNDLVGTWELESAIFDALKRDGYPQDKNKTYQIKLNEDGSCEFNTLMDVFQDVSYHDINGEWSLTQTKDGRYGLYLHLHEEETDITLVFHFAKSGSSLIFWQYYSDPDMWDFFEYKKLE